MKSYSFLKQKLPVEINIDMISRLADQSCGTIGTQTDN